MPETIHVWIGTEQCQRESLAELVLERSIRQHASWPVEIHYMRAGDPGWETTKRGKNGTWAVGDAVHGGWVKSNNRSWGTGFSGFRWAIPELMGFEGHAIYLDADMLLLDDITELYQFKPDEDKGVRCISHNRTDVMVMNCAWFKDRWPTIAQMKPSLNRSFEYLQIIHAQQGLQADLPQEWNDCDGQLFSNGSPSKLLHYTTVPDGQPWRPYPNINYPTKFPYCRNEEIGVLWWAELEEALHEAHGLIEGHRIYEEHAAAR